MLVDRGNGREKDEKWVWKGKEGLKERGAHENAIPKRELRDLD